jgi:hypothetical protein
VKEIRQTREETTEKRQQRRDNREETTEKREEETPPMPSAIAIRKIEGKPGKVYYPLEKISIPEPKPEKDEVFALAVPVHLLTVLIHPPRSS